MDENSVAVVGGYKVFKGEGCDVWTPWKLAIFIQMTGIQCTENGGECTCARGCYNALSVQFTKKREEFSHPVFDESEETLPAELHGCAVVLEVRPVVMTRRIGDEIRQRLGPPVSVLNSHPLFSSEENLLRFRRFLR